MSIIPNTTSYICTVESTNALTADRGQQRSEFLAKKIVVFFSSAAVGCRYDSYLYTKRVDVQQISLPLVL